MALLSISELTQTHHETTTPCTAIHYDVRIFQRLQFLKTWMEHESALFPVTWFPPAPLPCPFGKLSLQPLRGQRSATYTIQTLLQHPICKELNI